jgi:hypothetical protein
VTAALLRNGASPTREVERPVVTVEHAKKRVPQPTMWGPTHSEVRRARGRRPQRHGLVVGRRGVRVALVTGLVSGRARRAGVVVALEWPDVLARAGAPVRIATYGATSGAMDALVAFLSGTGSAPDGCLSRSAEYRGPGAERSGFGKYHANGR